MFGFLLKKNFCDGWDNLFSLVILNVLFLVCEFGVILLDAFVVSNLSEDVNSTLFILIQVLFVFLAIFVINIFSFTYGEQAVIVADFGGVRLLDFFKIIPSVLKDAFLMTLLVTVVLFVSAYSITFYMFDQQTLTGLFVGSLLFWIDVFLALSLQWFVPIRSTFHNDFMKCLKKSFIIFMDNTGFSISIFIYNIILIILTIPPIGFFPSVIGITLAQQNAFRLRMYKYDYLEEHPELKTPKERRQIPWEELIFEDRETLGPRKLKSFLFPWKE